MFLDVDPFSVTLATPLSTARGTIDEREGFVVRLEADDGTVEGVGEATPLPGWTESLDRCRRALERAADVVAEDGPSAALEALSGEGRDDRTPTPAARHGLALALADRRARRDGEPLYRHLGAPAEVDRVPVNGTVGDEDPDAVASAVRAAVEEGFECVKIKVGARNPDFDRDRIAAAREAAGPDATLRADVNGDWDLPTASAAMGWLDEYGVEYVEQPLGADDLQGHAALRGGPVGVAVDESLREHAVEDVLSAEAADVVVCKPMVLGGPDRARKAIEQVRPKGVEAVVTTTIDAVYARTGAVHVAASVDSPTTSGLATATLLETDLAPDPAAVEDGSISVPQGPGLGVPLETGLDGSR